MPITTRAIKMLFIILSVMILICGCTSSSGNPSEPEQPSAREKAIPETAIKGKPETDVFPPVLHSDEWESPVPMEFPINTSGAEDSPFVTPDGNTFYFFFTPDANISPQKQLTDGVTGIWWSNKINGKWTKPERIVLHNDVSLDGAVFIQGDTMWFASVRAGNYKEVDIYTAKLKNGKWTDVKNAGKQLNEEYDIGELHISPDGQTMYYGNPGDDRNYDIYTIKKMKDGWDRSVKLLPPVNTREYNENQPFITPDGSQLWFTGTSRLRYTGPATFRSIKVEDGSWGQPEEIISNFAGEPTLDSKGNIYFVHHFFSKNIKMIEADIYVAYRK